MAEDLTPTPIYTDMENIEETNVGIAAENEADSKQTEAESVVLETQENKKEDTDITSTSNPPIDTEKLPNEVPSWGPPEDDMLEEQQQQQATNASASAAPTNELKWETTEENNTLVKLENNDSSEKLITTTTSDLQSPAYTYSDSPSPYAPRTPMDIYENTGLTEYPNHEFAGCSSIEDYTILDKLGEGTFGEVHKGQHKSSGKIVALKRIIMHNEKEGIPITAIREIKILRQLNHTNVISLSDMAIQYATDAESTPSIYMVFPYMDHDLAGLLENPSVKFTPPQIKCYLKQLLEGTFYLHQQRILHRDLKAANLLINNQGILKIADFGLSRPMIEKSLTGCVVTRWYRPPELLLGERRYNTAIDMWAVGCVFAEMLRGAPILPGRSDMDQLDLIFKLCGSPNEKSMPGWQKLPGCRDLKPAIMYERKVVFEYQKYGTQAADLLDRLLVLNPAKRLTAFDALDHDYFWTDPMPADPKDLPAYEDSHEYDRRKHKHDDGRRSPYVDPESDPRVRKERNNMKRDRSRDHDRVTRRNQQLPTVSEDCVYYSLYFSFLESFSREQKEKEQQQYKYLQETNTIILSELQPFLKNYLWQKDPFQLRIDKEEKAADQLPSSSYYFLTGQTRFGDCIEDEWFIVFLLQKISLKLSDVVIHVSDNDGEFLLIESAMQLPNWLDPSNDQNRVFIHQGNLHIIPINETFKSKLSLEEGVNIVRNNPQITKADEAIQKLVFTRIAEYPQKATQIIHHARAHIPKAIVHVLYHRPQLVAAAVEAFYTRDQLAMKACYKMEKFPPSTSITTIVKMTKTLYAQLVSQRFHPPKPFKLPPPSEDAKAFKAAELGMKLACGFEILCTDSYYANSIVSLHTRVFDNVETYPFDLDPDWNAYQENLSKRGYYRGELPGSKLYKELYAFAKQQYLKDRSQRISSQDQYAHESPSPLGQINEIMELPMESDEVLASVNNEREDDDAWMNIDPRDFESMVNMMETDVNFGGSAKEKKNNDDENFENIVDLNKTVEDFEKFVDFEKSGLEGAEFLDEYSSDEDNSNNDSDQEGGDSMIDKDISFDPSEFLNALRRTLGVTNDEYQKMVNAKFKKTSKADQPISNQPITTIPSSSSTRPQSLPPDNSTSSSLSFTTATNETITTTSVTEIDDDTSIESYMDVMDTELASTKVAKSFVRDSKDIEKNLSGSNKDKDRIDKDEEEEDETFVPVNIELNTVTNLLASFKAQGGLPGPAGNIMGRLGVNVLPQDVDSDDDSNYDDG
ncbi:12092_t:CDS:10 [Ambispora gerdemannii]|uniref:12092_t:CDS:1 n=1 Tax=Ambispora gerdemannii TaxID=144530 RepID=A0A9N8ZC07_9GLOM|nr:12092_t:CDS:10 [Ambispora gerdemannii]